MIRNTVCIKELEKNGTNRLLTWPFKGLIQIDDDNSSGKQALLKYFWAYFSLIRLITGTSSTPEVCLQITHTQFHLP